MTSEAVVASESLFLFVVRTFDFFWKFLIFSESNGMIFSETKQLNLLTKFKRRAKTGLNCPNKHGSI